MGKDLMNGNFGPRYVKYSDNRAEHGLWDDVTYIGEWSTKTNLPHGRGITINIDGMHIGDWNNGDWTGKYIDIDNDGEFVVGEITIDADGKMHVKSMRYNPDGTTE